MEEILSSLQEIGSFRKVLSRTSTEQYRGIIRPPIPKIAKDLDVNFIVEGSGQKYGNFYQISVQLIEGKTDKHLWAHSYEREIKDTKDIFGIQSQIAQAIAAELKAIISPEEKQKIEKIPTTNLIAYDLYRRGSEQISSYGIAGLNRESIAKAEVLFKRALEYDSTFAGGYIGLAQVYWKKYALEYLEIYADSMLILANKALD